uniref:MAM domain-containing protein n=1 Tax=Plectus sambesii TaxID=2011161 RepID=A0A914UML1_9BILA
MRLIVCDMEMDNCLWERQSSVADRKGRSTWQLGSIVLPAGRHQILFVVENLSVDKFVAVDEINLRQTRDGPMAHCQMEI